MTFTILTVCTGNVCRSPVAELQLAVALDGVAGVRVSSAGTRALVGHEVPATTARMSREYGLDTTNHRGREITEPLIREADLVLTMTRDHRRAVVESVPAAIRRTFTLREFARIVDLADVGLADALASEDVSEATDAMRVAVARAAALRGSVAPPDDPSELDVTDPFGRSEETYRLSFAQLIPAGQRVAGYLAVASTAIH